MRKAAVYCRVSDPSESRDNVSLQTQRNACIELADKMGYQVEPEYIAFETFSGLTLERPVLRKVLGWVNRSEISALFIYSTDRFSRDAYDLLTLIRECDCNNVTLKCVTEDIENGPTGELISYVRGYASKLEAVKIRERTMRGKKALAEAGGIPGGFGRSGYLGLRYDKSQKCFVHTEQIDTAREILRRGLQGESTSQITRDLQSRNIKGAGGGPIHRSSVHRVLANAKVYAGTTSYMGHMIEGKIGPIITEDEANAILARLKKNKERSYAAGKQMWMSRRVICLNCGRKFFLDKRTGCRCYGNDSRVPNRCDSPKMKLDELNALTYGAMCFAIIEPEAVIEQARSVHEEWGHEKEEYEKLQINARKRQAQREKRRRLLSFQHEQGGLTDNEYIKRLGIIKKEEQDELNLAPFSKPEPLTPEQAAEVYDLLQAYKPLRLHFDEVMNNPRDKFVTELAEKIDLKIYIGPPKEEGQRYTAYVTVNLPIPDKELSFPCEEDPVAKVNMSTVSNASSRVDLSFRRLTG